MLSFLIFLGIVGIFMGILILTIFLSSKVSVPKQDVQDLAEFDEWSEYVRSNEENHYGNG